MALTSLCLQVFTVQVTENDERTGSRKIMALMYLEPETFRERIHCILDDGFRWSVSLVFSSRFITVVVPDRFLNFSASGTGRGQFHIQPHL